jgi:hypothetical protein
MRRDGVWNEAERRPVRRINLDADHLGLEPLQPLEISQNRQRYIWKSLSKTADIWKSLQKSLGGGLYSATSTPPPDPPPTASTPPPRRARTTGPHPAKTVPPRAARA